MATERWNDEMLDRLADSVNQLTEREIQISSVVGTLSLRMNDFQESLEQTNHNIEILIGAVNGVLARDIERQQEVDQLRQEAIAREERLREEAIAREERFREEAIAREERLREEAIAREERLREEAIAREDRLREEAIARQQESEAYRRENDQRFNILLEEIRFLIRREREE